MARTDGPTLAGAEAAIRPGRFLVARPSFGQICAMLHIAKLAVGIRDVPHLRAVQAARSQQDPPLRHRTRNTPRRAAEIVSGGSIYWVIAGVMMVRQRIVAVREDVWDDGRSCTGLVLDPELVPVAGRLVRAFQGWRYLEASDAPPDLASLPHGDGEAMLPPEMQRQLRALGLL